MIVTLAGSFSEVGPREDVLAPSRKARESAILVLADDRGRVVLAAVDAKTSRATHRIVLENGEALIAALHALETIAHLT